MKTTHVVLPLLLVAISLFHGCGGKNPSTVHLQNLGNGVCLDTTSGLMWQSEESQTIGIHEEAQRYVSNLSLGGHTDWRLPTRQELYDLTYLFDLGLNGECILNPEGNYWSVSVEGKQQGVAGEWQISANQCDPIRVYLRGHKGHVRAVRP